MGTGGLAPLLESGLQQVHRDGVEKLKLRLPVRECGLLGSWGAPPHLSSSQWSSRKCCRRPSVELLDQALCASLYGHSLTDRDGVRWPPGRKWTPAR